jgi:hypothetical protein
MRSWREETVMIVVLFLVGLAAAQQQPVRTPLPNEEMTTHRRMLQLAVLREIPILG